MKTKLLLGLGLALFTIGCGPEPGPDKPSFEKDIKPIMLAHCVRCHGAGGALNKDPKSIGMAFRDKAPASAWLSTFEDPPNCPTGAVCYGARKSAQSIAAYVPGVGEERMPPPPADPLSDIQVDLITRWTKAMPLNP